MQASWSQGAATAGEGPPERGTTAAPAQEATRPSAAEIFDKHGAFVARALRCLGVGERELPDACQEVFLVVHRRLPAFEGRSSIRTWLYGICVRQAMRARRKRARRREQPVADPPEPDEPRRRCDTPEDDLRRGRALGQAQRILDELDEDKRAVFVLYEVEQLPMSEIAEALGCPLQTAYSRLYAARRDVRRVLRRLRAGGQVE